MPFSRAMLDRREPTLVRSMPARLIVLPSGDLAATAAVRSRRPTLDFQIRAATARSGVGCGFGEVLVGVQRRGEEAGEEIGHGNLPRPLRPWATTSDPSASMVAG